jgi:hypothetical protein
MLFHRPVLTFDVDILVEDKKDNLKRLNEALAAMKGEWGKTESSWQAVPEDSKWLERQPLFCLTTQYGPLDIFREVPGLENKFEECWQLGREGKTSEGIVFKGLSDYHMLECQLVLEPEDQKPERIKILRTALGKNND